MGHGEIYIHCRPTTTTYYPLQIAWPRAIGALFCSLSSFFFFFLVCLLCFYFYLVDVQFSFGFALAVVVVADVLCE